MYRGYVFAVSEDEAGLGKAISRLTPLVELMGSEFRSWAPLADEVASWYAQMTDEAHVIRSTAAVIASGMLCVQSGLLISVEGRIKKFDRHHRRCQVRVGDENLVRTSRIRRQPGVGIKAMETLGHSMPSNMGHSVPLDF